MARTSKEVETIPDLLKSALESSERLCIQFSSVPEMEDKIKSFVSQVQQSFEFVDRKLPGFTQDFLRNFMDHFGFKDFVDIEAMTLRLSAMDVEIPQYVSNIPHCQVLEKNALELKLVLSHIPTEINRRTEFLVLIKQIASAIKTLLDCIKLILEALTAGIIKQGLDEHMRNFIEYSRKFSSSLKKYFRDHLASELFASACMLVQQTNLILVFVRNSSSSLSLRALS